MAQKIERLLVQLDEADLTELIRAAVRDELATRQPDNASAQLPRQLTVDEAADALRCSTRQVRRLIALGRLKATKLTHGRSARVRVPRTELERLIKESTGV